MQIMWKNHLKQRIKSLILQCFHAIIHRLGNYKTAIESFHNVINVKSDHLFAHYFASKCFEKLGKIDEMKYHNEQVNKIRANTDFWDHYIDEFNLPIKKMYNNKNIRKEEMIDKMLNL